MAVARLNIQYDYILSWYCGVLGFKCTIILEIWGKIPRTKCKYLHYRQFDLLICMSFLIKWDELKCIGHILFHSKVKYKWDREILFRKYLFFFLYDKWRPRMINPDFSIKVRPSVFGHFLSFYLIYSLQF